LSLDLPFERHKNRKIRIKLEIDTSPPVGSNFTTSYITFPVTTPLTTQSLTSGFGLKLHALLCRPYTKGRDWYDFVWYVARKTLPDLDLLRHALMQQGPWAEKDIPMSLLWVKESLRETIRHLDWDCARQDVQLQLPASNTQKKVFPAGRGPAIPFFSTPV